MPWPEVHQSVESLWHVDSMRSAVQSISLTMSLKINLGKPLSYNLLRRRHSSYHRHVEPPLAIVRFRLLRRVPWIPFQFRVREIQSHCLRSAVNWKQHCLPSLFRQT